MNAAVRSGEHVVRIFWIDPHRMIIPVNPMHALRVERLPAILGVKHLRAQLPNPQIVIGINSNLAVIRRSRVRFAHPLPRLAFVFAAERPAFFMLDLGINNVGIFAVNIQPDAPGIAAAVFVRQPFRQFLPRHPAIRGLVNRAVRPAAVEAERRAPPLVRGRI